MLKGMESGSSFAVVMYEVLLSAFKKHIKHPQQLSGLIFLPRPIRVSVAALTQSTTYEASVCAQGCVVSE